MKPGRFIVRIMPRAAKDLSEIVGFLITDSENHGRDVAIEIITAIDSLDCFPLRCRIHKSSREPGRVVRSMLVEPYLVYYRVLASRNCVEVLTVRHGARRQPKRFSVQ
jgi:plasmid stabilization system protein ParE